MLVLSPSIVLSAAEAGYVAYDVRLDRLYRLNPTAALILELCDGTRDRDGLRTDLEPVVGGGWQGWLDWIDTALNDRLVIDLAEASAEGTADAQASGAGLDAAALARHADDLQHRDRVLAAFVCQERAAELAPSAPDVLLRLGELAHIVGRRETARQAYQRYLAERPDDAEVAHLVTALTDAAAPPRVSDRCIEQLYSRFAAFYDENMTGELEYCAPDRLYDAVSRALAVGGEPGCLAALDVLDLGCGTGLSGGRWRPLAARLIGIDLSPEMIAHARARGVYDSLETAEITGWLSRHRADRFDLILACRSCATNTATRCTA